MLHHKCIDCLCFGKLNFNHINVVILVSFQINLVYVRLYTETFKQTESSYKRYHIPSIYSIFNRDFLKYEEKKVREKLNVRYV